MLLFLFMLVLSGCWSVAFIGFRSSFSCLLSLRGCFCSSAAFSGLFSLVLFGGFRLSSGFAVPFVLFCCSGFAASSWILLRCIYWLSNSFLCCCFWVSNMCFDFIQGVQFLSVSFGGVLLMLCRRCCDFLLQVALKPLGCFGALKIAPLAFPVGSPILEPLVVDLCLCCVLVSGLSLLLVLCFVCLALAARLNVVF
ncbi:hypothetical protein U1Q18_031278 [Sarracenia purpurea var. burkii]